MKKKEYIFLSTGYAGGASRFIYDHINHLTKKNKKTILVDDKPFKTFSKIPKKTLVKKIMISRFNFSSNKKLKKLFLNKKNEKIVFLTNYGFIIRYFNLVNELNNNKIKIILTIHSGLLDLTIKNYFAGFLFSLIYKKVDYLYFGSHSAKQWWLRFYPWMDIKNNLVHFNGVELQKITKRKKNKKLLVSFVGRLEKENNPEFFLKIANDYLKDFNNAIFNIYGEGTMYNHLINISKYDDIKFHGWKNNKDIYRNSDIILITGKINNFPYVALEAKSYGIPVISCSKGDIKKIIKNNFDGFINYTNSSKTIINLINRISKKYSKFSKNSFLRSKLFEIDSSCKKFWNNIL